jgi:thiol-disulfide isomerase/thioredoxin
MVVSAGGETHPVRELANGRVMVIDLWATWCTACRDGIPRLEQVAHSYSQADL